VSEFVTALRAQVEQAQRGLDQARQAGDGDLVHRHSARLLDLLDRAAAHGVDTAGWVPPDALALASTVAGNST
jgi:hypothetical protein